LTEQEHNPPYSYYNYFMYANIAVLNKLRYAQINAQSGGGMAADCSVLLPVVLGIAL
jgi:hypothetical protein